MPPCETDPGRSAGGPRSAMPLPLHGGSLPQSDKTCVHVRLRKGAGRMAIGIVRVVGARWAAKQLAVTVAEVISIIHENRPG